MDNAARSKAESTPSMSEWHVLRKLNMSAVGHGTNPLRRSALRAKPVAAMEWRGKREPTAEVQWQRSLGLRFASRGARGGFVSALRYDRIANYFFVVGFTALRVSS